MNMELKRFFGVILSLALMIGLLPGMSLTAHAATPYLMVKGNTVNLESDSSGEGWSYDHASKTLTLDGFNSDDGIISGIDGLTVIVNGDTNTIDGGGFGITSEGSLNIEGSGTLNIISTGNTAISSLRDLTISGNVNITAEASGAGIACEDAYKLTLESTGIINVKGSYWGLYSGGEIQITNGDVTAEGGISGIGQNGGGTPLVIGTNAKLIAIGGDNGAIYYNTDSNYRKVQNAIAGVAWTNQAGTEGRFDIGISENGQSILNTYKKVQFPSHTHSFTTYTATGATIMATCTADGCTLPESSSGADDHVATLTISASGGTYDGTTTYGATITDANSIQGDAKVQYQKKTDGSYGTATETAPTDAGDYKASITVGGATASVEYTIAQADPTANAPTGLTATCGQTLANVSLEGKNPEGNTPGTWAWADAATTSVGSVGVHTFKANFTPTDTTNYNSKSNVDVTVTVGKADNPATVTSTATVTKGGNTVDLAGNVTKNGATGDVSYAISSEANGCSLSGSVLTSGDTTGTVTVNVTVAADSNYKELAATPITVTISDKGTQTITAENVTATYGDTDKKVNATTDGDGAISYAVKDGSADYIDVNGTTGVLTIKKVPADGKAYVVVTAAETNVYAQATKDVTVTISKAKAVPATVTANNRTYDETEKPLVTVTGEATGGKMQYALGTDDKTAPTDGWSTEIPTGTEAKTYYIWYKVKADDNHNDTEPNVLTVTIDEEIFVRYHSNGGSGNMSEQKVEKNIVTELKTNAFTREGYSFKEWNTKENGSGTSFADKAEVTLEVSLDLYAQWNKVEVHTHHIEKVEAIEPRCETDGNKTYYRCIDEGCDKWFEDETMISEITDKSSVIIKAIGHKWGAYEVTKRPTYDEEGLKVYTCENDPSHTKEETIPRLSSSSSSDSDSDSDSSGSRSSSGSSSKNSASQAMVDEINNVTSGNVPENHQAESGVAASDVGGKWANEPNADTWTYTKSDGTLAKSEWMSLDYNGLRYWYYFNDDGNMRTNWFDYNNERFYLMPEKDGWRGRMATGWKNIENKWYYFETVPGSSQGRLYRSTLTPDGHTVGADGAWNGVGETPVGQK